MEAKQATSATRASEVESRIFLFGDANNAVITQKTLKEKSGKCVGAAVFMSTLCCHVTVWAGKI